MLQQKLQETLDKSLLYPHDNPQAGLPRPLTGTAVETSDLAARAKEIRITQDSIALIGLITRHSRYNDFNPALLLLVEKSLTASAQPAIDGSVIFPRPRGAAQR